MLVAVRLLLSEDESGGSSVQGSAIEPLHLHGDQPWDPAGDPSSSP